MRHGPGGLGDDERVTGIGFRLSGVKIRDPAHRQARQVADQHPGGLGHRDGNAPMVAGWSTTNRIRPLSSSSAMISRILASSLGSARSSNFLPARFTATA